MRDCLCRKYDLLSKRGIPIILVGLKDLFHIDTNEYFDVSEELLFLFKLNKHPLKRVSSHGSLKSKPLVNLEVYLFIS